MRSRNLLKTKAIVLRTINYGDSDRIVTFYTRDFGKLTGIAKGARQSRKRFANALEPISCLQLLFYRKSRDTMAIIETCDMVCHFDKIRDNLDKILQASYILDLTNHFTIEDKKGESLFDLLDAFLAAIDICKPTDSLARFFELRLLKLMGYEPVLDRCIKCKKVVENGGHYLFSVHDGGLTCLSCYPPSGDSLPISVGTIRTLLMGSNLELSQMDRLGLPVSVVEESCKVLHAFISHLLGRELKSLRVLDEIRRLSA
ncbi:MAG: DNA repair protein RecO [Syntrophales bacterium]|jgi:DNA repair protein RecO (recombination protein O)